MYNESTKLPESENNHLWGRKKSDILFSPLLEIQSWFSSPNIVA